uniref:DegT/DnrJ/EryC1/StrS family aminotransferase n=1 Tax=[Ruminococcus] torques TaxID=33039 RepID=UPI003AF10C98
MESRNEGEEIKKDKKRNECRNSSLVVYFSRRIFSFLYIQNMDASMFSFHATKVYNSIEGGAITFHDQEFGLDLYRLKNFGIRGEEVID